MSSIEPFTPEGIDPNSSYLATCINRVNTNYKTAIATLSNNIITINVKDYGAVGDNINDDTSAINSAISALPSSNSILYFPRGKYKISDTITIENKNYLLIKSDNAEIIITQSNSQGFWFKQCSYLQFVDGCITFTTTSIAGNISKQAIVYEFLGVNSFPDLKNITILGAFTYGLHIFKHIGVPNNGTGTITNLKIDGLNVGHYGLLLNQDSEYMECIGMNIENLLYTGIKIDGGNHYITSTITKKCRIGIHIDGASVNSDHGAITGCSVNHNRACGIFIRDTKFSFNITGNNIWANNGPDNLTDAINTTARGFHYGVYIENSKGINLSGNTIAHNDNVEIGIDGMSLSLINNNVIRSTIPCLFPIYEWYSPNYPNFHNQICNNTFNGTNTPGNIPSLNRIYLGNAVNDTAYNYLIKNNTGENWSNDLLINVNSGDYYIGIANNYIINPFIVSTTNASNPNSQTANIYILPHATGTKFKIYFTSIGSSSSYTWLRYKTNSNNVPNIIGTSITYFTANKCFRITNNVRYVDFTPLSNSIFTHWNVIAGDISNNIIVNVKDYGALGNNVNDDTSAINSAISALGSSLESYVLYFPRGTYRISGKVEILNKSNILIMSDGASLRHMSGIDTLWINGCVNVKMSGNLYIYTQTTGLTCQALVIKGCSFCDFSGIHINGDFTYGIHIFEDSGYNGSSISATITNCKTGIFIPNSSEYFMLYNCCISNCGTGIYILGPNIYISNCIITTNRIGIQIQGDSGAGSNTDHCSIVSCSINHNRACGIFLKNLTFTTNITGNNIWANNGADDLTEAVNTAGAKNYHYGIYLEKVVGVSIVGNIIAHNNDIEIGIDGMRNSIINNNIFRGVPESLFPIYEWYTAGTLNYYNQICNNVFQGTSTSITGLTASFSRIYLGNMANDAGYNYMIKDNTGENWNNDLFITANFGDYYIGTCNNYIIDSFLVSTTDSANPDSQTAKIYILPHATGTKFKINFSKLTGSGFYTWIRYKTNSNNTPTLAGPGVNYYVANKSFRITNLWYLDFTPLSNSTVNNWLVYGYGSGSV